MGRRRTGGTDVGELMIEEAQVEALVTELDKVAESVPAEERDAYDKAQESIVEARRSAEMHEGTLQLH